MVICMLNLAELHTNILEKDNPTALVLDPKHPGIKDVLYVKRRQQLFHLARQYRLNQNDFPLVDYTSEEHILWKTISEKLASLHEEKAAPLYLAGKRILSIKTSAMPQLAELNRMLQQAYNIKLIPAEGLLSSRSFHHYLYQRYMPCTLFLRHPADPLYTPEPDAVHDLIGHVPPLTNSTYADLMQLIGHGVKLADEKQLIAWSRVYWFAIEFGLIEAKNDIKILGAGLLSSCGEMVYAFSDNVLRKPFDLDEVIETDYDNTCMQDLLFVIPSLEFLKNEIMRLLKRFTA